LSINIAHIGEQLTSLIGAKNVGREMRAIQACHTADFAGSGRWALSGIPRTQEIKHAELMA